MADDNAILQHSWYVGTILMAILYGLHISIVVPASYSADRSRCTGIELSLYFVSMKLILGNNATGRRGRNARETRGNKVHLWLSNILLFMITSSLIVQCFFGEQMWITNENYPGGTGAWFADHISVWYETYDTGSSLVRILITDGFLVSS